MISRFCNLRTLFFFLLLLDRSAPAPISKAHSPETVGCALQSFSNIMICNYPPSRKPSKKEKNPEMSSAETNYLEHMGIGMGLVGSALIIKKLEENNNRKKKNKKFLVRQNVKTVENTPSKPKRTLKTRSRDQTFSEQSYNSTSSEHKKTSPHSVSPEQDVIRRKIQAFVAGVASTAAKLAQLKTLKPVTGFTNPWGKYNIQFSPLLTTRDNLLNLQAELKDAVWDDKKFKKQFKKAENELAFLLSLPILIDTALASHQEKCALENSKAEFLKITATLPQSIPTSEALMPASSYLDQQARTQVGETKYNLISETKTAPAREQYAADLLRNIVAYDTQGDKLLLEMQINAINGVVIEWVEGLRKEHRATRDMIALRDGIVHRTDISQEMNLLEMSPDHLAAHQHEQLAELHKKVINFSNVLINHLDNPNDQTSQANMTSDPFYVLTTKHARTYFENPESKPGWDLAIAKKLDAYGEKIQELINHNKNILPGMCHYAFKMLNSRGYIFNRTGLFDRNLAMSHRHDAPELTEIRMSI